MFYLFAVILQWFFFLSFLCFLPAACLYTSTWEFYFYKVFIVFALRQVFKHLKHFRFLMFEVNIVLLCHVQHVNFYGLSILKSLELKSHSHKHVLFSIQVNWDQLQNGCVNEHGEVKNPFSWRRSLNLQRLNAQVGCVQVLCCMAMVGICWMWCEQEAQEIHIEFFTLLNSALILCVPPFSHKVFTIPDESWDKHTENCESLK